ncbi:uncharacterized protein LOC144095668 [Amblyomma americanum]
MVKHSSLFFQVALLWTIATPSRDAHPKEPLLLQPHEPVQTPPSASKNRPTDGNLPPSLAGTNSFVWQPGATSCAANPPRLLQAPPFYGQFWHGTATNMVKHSSLFFQVALLWTIAAPSRDAHPKEPLLLQPHEPVQTPPSASKNRPTDGNLPPSLAGTNSFVWQPGATSCAANPPRLLQAPPFYGQLGHGTATNMVKHSSLFFQVALLWTIAAPSRDAHPKEPLLLQPHEPVQTPPSASKNRPTDGNLPPSLAGTNSFVWQPGATSCAANPPRLLQAPPFYGQLGWPSVNTVSNPFMFFIQVSKASCTFKSSNPYLFQLTCPECICTMCAVASDFVFSVLIICGDVEPNPGPSTEQLLGELLEGQKQIRNRLDDIESRLKIYEDSVSAISEVCSVARSLEKKVQGLELKLTDLEDRSRRNNLLVFGVKEKENETHEDLEESVLKDVFTEILGAHVSSVERIHRIGRKQPDKVRPVIIKFYDHREKMNILKNCFKLKNGSVSVSEDFSAATRMKRKQLWDSAASNKKNGQKVKLIYDKLKIDNDLFEWDEERKIRVPVSRKDKQST